MISAVANFGPVVSIESGVVAVAVLVRVPGKTLRYTVMVIVRGEPLVRFFSVQLTVWPKVQDSPAATVAVITAVPVVLPLTQAGSVSEILTVGAASAEALETTRV